MKTLSKSLLFTLPTSHHARLDCLCIQEGNLIMENNEEIWKDVVGYESYYQISNIGNLRSLDHVQKINTSKKKYHRNRIGQNIKLSKQSGYTYACLYVNGKSKRCTMHRLVAMAFITNPENKKCINHKNSIRDDNRIENLEWCTHSENNRHAHQVGGQRNYYGEKHSQSVLTKVIVDEIRLKYKKYIYTMPMLAADYSVSIGCIQAVLENKTWAAKK